jgi:type I restriction enzyme S subunit
MSDGISTTLGKIFAVDNTKLGPHSEEPTVMSLSKYTGFVRADEYFDKRIASSSLHAYKVVEPGEWAFSTIHIDEGSIARNNLGERGVISPMYTTMRFVAKDCIPEYAELLVRQPGMLAEYSRRARGSINRRRSLPFKAFAEIAIVLPSRADQGRIVDIMIAVDAQIDMLDSERQTIKSLLAVMRDVYPEGTERALSHVVAGIDSGKSVQTSDERPLPGQPAILKLSAIQLGSFMASEAKRLADLTVHTDAHMVVEGDLLITRASGSFDRVGYATIARDVQPQTYMPDLIWRIRTKPEVCQSTFLAHLLCSPSVRSMITSSARGTASMRKINKAMLGSLRLPIPSLEEQSAYVERCDAVAFAAESLDLELADLRAFRSTLLTALLNHEIEIPESYDSLLEKVF